MIRKPREIILKSLKSIEELVVACHSLESGERFDEIGFDASDLSLGERAELLDLVRSTWAMNTRPILGQGGIGWFETDPLILQSVGQASRAIGEIIATCLGNQFQGTFLDVGAGVGCLSQALLEKLPLCRVVALEPHDCARELAKERLGPFGSRAEVQLARFENFIPNSKIDVVFVPTHFLNIDAIETGLNNLQDSSVFLACLTLSSDPIIMCAKQIRSQKCGGSHMLADQGLELLKMIGFSHPQIIHRTWQFPIDLVMADPVLA